MREAQRPVLIVGASDPGAANVLIPVVQHLLKDQEIEVISFCGEPARSRFIGSGVAATESSVDAESLLKQLSPKGVLVGTSEDCQSIDRRLTKAARKEQIMSFCVLDYWSQYHRRFSAPGEHFVYLPDHVYVMDQAAGDGLFGVGVPKQNIQITGHPHLEQFRASAPAVDSKKLDEFKPSLGIEPEEIVITFASETFGWSHDANYRFPPLSGDKERTVIILEHVLQTLKQIAPRCAKRIVLVNKLHPKNRFEEFSWIDAQSLPFRVLPVKDTDLIALLQASSIVIGMTSMLLVESVSLGRPTLSIVPRAIEEQIGPNGGQSWSLARTPQELSERLSGWLRDPAAANGDWNRIALDLEAQHRGSVQRIVSHLYSRLGIGESVAA